MSTPYAYRDKDDPMRKYYADGTIYSGEWNGHTMERRFSNAQIAIGLIVFSFVAGFIQVKVVRYGIITQTCLRIVCLLHMSSNSPHV